jgi:hypothetical protein
VTEERIGGGSERHIAHGGASILVHYIGTVFCFLILHVMVLEPSDGPDAWHPWLTISHCLLAILQLGRGATLFSQESLAALYGNDGVQPIELVKWAFPTACAFPGLGVGLLGHLRCIGPWRAVRSWLRRCLSVARARCGSTSAVVVRQRPIPHFRAR